MAKQTAYEKWTARAVESIQELAAKGLAPWERAIKDGVPTRPCNALTGRAYNGGNEFWLNISQLVQEFDDPRWVTYKQARSLGGHVCRGARGTPILIVASKTRKARAGEDPDEEHWYRHVGSATVFNVSQCEGIPEPQWLAEGALPQEVGEAKAWRLVANIGVAVHENGAISSALGQYHIGRDTITVRPREQFKSPAEHVKVLMHELAHWTGHHTRLARIPAEEAPPHNSAQGAMEELVAELAAYSMCTVLGLPFTPDHSVRYMEHFRTTIADDPTVYLEASKQAAAACKLICDLGDPGRDIIPQAMLRAGQPGKQRTAPRETARGPVLAPW